MKQRGVLWAFLWLASASVAFLAGRATAPRDGGVASSASNDGANRTVMTQPRTHSAGESSTAPRDPTPDMTLSDAARRLNRLGNRSASKVLDGETTDRSGGDEPITFSKGTNVDSLSQSITEKLRKFLGDRGEVLSVDCAEYPCIAYLSTTEMGTNKGLGNEFMGQMVQALSDVGFSRSMIELSQRGDGTLAISVETDESKPLDSEDVRHRVNKRVSEYFDEFDP